MSRGPGAARVAAPGLPGGRAAEALVDLRFETASGGRLRAVDLAGGSSRAECTADVAQQTVLLVPRSAPEAAGGAALFLDGWSTHIEVERSPERERELAVEAWFAPRAFAGGDRRGFTPIIDATAPSGAASHAPSDGVSLGHDRMGRLAADIAGRLIVADTQLRLGHWHRLGLIVADGRGELVLDGRPVADFETDVAELTVPGRIVLGRARDGELVEGLFPAAAAVGLLGRVLIETRSGEPRAADRAAEPVGSADLAPDRSRYAADPHRPIAHLSAPQGWMNEPHAAIQADGLHHVFFQHNPAGPYWGRIAWGHAVSRDLVHWEDAGLAVTPGTSPVAPDGVWSGSSVIGAAGEHLLYVTAGDFGRIPDQSVAVARPVGRGADGGWVIDPEPVLRMPASVPGRTEPLVPGQFRDPFVWRDGEDWFLIIGAGLQGQGGAALLYHSLDGDHWTAQPPLLVGDEVRFPATGVMWELPVLLPIGMGADGIRRHALFIAPWWTGPSEHHLQHVWHWVGVWDAAARRFTPDHEDPREFDGGGHLTGPSGTVLDDGRAILWTIAQDTRTLAEFAASGWAHNAGLPLELGLHDDGTLRVQPVAESALLRERAVVPLLISDGAATGALGANAIELRGRHLDLEIDVEGPGFEIELLRSDDGSETTLLGVDGPEVWIDRSHSSLDTSHVEARRRAIRRPDAARVRARLVVDGSMVEFYVDDRVSLTSRAYPVTPDAVGLRLRVRAGARLLHFAAHELHSAYEPRPRPRKADPTC